MTVINFQDKLKRKEDQKETTEQIKEILKEYFKRTVSFLEYVSLVPEISPTFIMFIKIMKESLTGDKFRDSVDIFGGMLKIYEYNFQPIIEACREIKEEVTQIDLDASLISSYEHVELTNAYVAETIELGSLTAIGLYTKQTLKTVLNIDVDQKFDQIPTIDLITVPDINTELYNYLYEHPDVDKERDWNALSVIGYEAIAALVRRDYFLSRCVYEVTNNKNKVVGPLLMEFKNNTPNRTESETVYFYFDFEALMLCSDAFLGQVADVVK